MAGTEDYSPGEQSGEATESSPLTSNHNQSRSSSPLVGTFVARLFRVFEFESNGDRSRDKSPDGEDNCHDDASSSSPSSCGLALILRLLAYLGVTMMVFFVGAHIGEENAAASLDANPIDSLKKTAFISGLKNGAVASDHEVCSNLGTSILQIGGNAVDAAVSTMLCLGVANPASSGVGGGAFMVIHSDRSNHEGRIHEQDSIPFEDKREPSRYIGTDMITEVIDCRETAPAAATEDMFSSLPDAASSIGALAIAVPGELRGLELAHARHGSLPWSELVDPVIQLARNGVPVSKHLAGDIKSMATEQTQIYGEYPKLRKLLTRHDDWKTYLREGELMRNPKLAETLEKVAKEGSDALYKGDLARKLVAEVRELGGILSVEDMEDYRPALRTPVFGETNGFTLVGVPPPSSGGATLIGAARFLDGYKLPLASLYETLSVHRMVEALRHAFAIRMSLSDPAFYPNKTSDVVRDLTEGLYMEELRKLTKDNSTLSLSLYGGVKWAQLHDSDGKSTVVDQREGDRRLGSISTSRQLARPFGYLEDYGTSHLSIVDQSGNAVSITSSVNQIFGSYVVSEGTGVLLGNTMDDFGNPGRSNYYGLRPSKENFVAPGKRPLSSMSPTMIFRNDIGLQEGQLGRLVLVLGGSGGPKIITSVLQVVINFCYLGMPLFEAMARPRVHDQLMYHDVAITTTEKDPIQEGLVIEVPERTKEALLARGHDALLDINYAGTVQAVSVDLETNEMSAVSDIRKGGMPCGW